MTQEERQLLLELLKKANSEGLLQIYQTEQTYEVDWCFEDNGFIYIRLGEE